MRESQKNVLDVKYERVQEENPDQDEDGVFWDVMPRGSCKNGRFWGTWLLHYQGNKNP
jgi:hypothetical protein